MQALFEVLAQFALTAMSAITTAHGKNTFGVLHDVAFRPIDDFLAAGLGRRDHITTGQRVELPGSRQVAELDAITARRVRDVDVPIVDGAVHFDHAQDGLGRLGSGRGGMSMTRSTGVAVCQNSARAARARSMAWLVTSQVACNQ